MREKEKSTQIIFVRHGKTDFPLDRIYCDDREDPPLSVEGLQQAERAARLLKERMVAAIYASPALRTRMTAEIIAQQVPRPLVYCEELRERRFGAWEGLYFHEIEAQYPEAYRRWKMDNAGFKPEGGESVFDLIERARVCLSNIAAAHAGESVVVVTHVGPIRALVADVIGLPLSAYRVLTIDYTSLTAVALKRSQNNLLYLNVVG